jgi:hypothetical protein
MQLVHLLPSWPLVPTACSLLGLALTLKQLDRGNYVEGWETLKVSLSLASVSVDIYLSCVRYPSHTAKWYNRGR